MKKLDKQKKRELVDFLTETLKENRVNLVVSFSRLSVPDMQNLRESVAKVNGKIMVTKNTLLQKTFENIDKKEVCDLLEGPLFVAWSKEQDEVALVKSIMSFSSKSAEVVIRGGIIDREVLSEQKMALIGKLPQKKELEAKLVMTLRYPAMRLVNALKFNMTRVILDIKQIKEKKEN